MLQAEHDVSVKMLSEDNPYRLLCDCYRSGKIPLVTYRDGSMVGENMKKFLKPPFITSIIILFDSMAATHPNSAIYHVSTVVGPLLSNYKRLTMTLQSQN